MSEDPKLTVQVNLDAMFAELCHRLQRCIDMVCFGVRAVPTGPANPTTLPLKGAWFHVVTAEVSMLKGEPLKAAFET